MPALALIILQRNLVPLKIVGGAPGVHFASDMLPVSFKSLAGERQQNLGRIHP